MGFSFVLMSVDPVFFPAAGYALESRSCCNTPASSEKCGSEKKPNQQCNVLLESMHSVTFMLAMVLSFELKTGIAGSENRFYSPCAVIARIFQDEVGDAKNRFGHVKEYILTSRLTFFLFMVNGEYLG